MRVPEIQGQSLEEVVLPGAPGQASRKVPAGEAGLASLPRHSRADVHFMRMMIVHHAQALEMTSLVPERTEREDVLLLARRMEAAQTDEMDWMERWLGLRGEPLEAPGPLQGGSHHEGAHGRDGAPADPPHAGMPGMLSRGQLGQLAAARAEAFDRLFLEFMIHHHEGALIMVRELFASEEGGQDGETYAFAAHVKSDQRTEIERMRTMLARGS